tara:strand:+ start:974 stop:1360 length:387 start_codon:yes stop_codon:yes gene_type:complete
VRCGAGGRTPVAEADAVDALLLVGLVLGLDTLRRAARREHATLVPFNIHRRLAQLALAHARVGVALRLELHERCCSLHLDHEDALLDFRQQHALDLTEQRLARHAGDDAVCTHSARIVVAQWRIEVAL